MSTFQIPWRRKFFKIENVVTNSLTGNQDLKMSGRVFTPKHLKTIHDIEGKQSKMLSIRSFEQFILDQTSPAFFG